MCSRVLYCFVRKARQAIDNHNGISHNTFNYGMYGYMQTYRHTDIQTMHTMHIQNGQIVLTECYMFASVVVSHSTIIC